MKVKDEFNSGTEIKCHNCQKRLQPGEFYRYMQKVLCEQCCLDMCTPKTRKTHWQYIGSIKTQYLIPRKKRR